MGGFSYHLCCHRACRQTNALRLVPLEPAWVVRRSHCAQLAAAVAAAATAAAAKEPIQGSRGRDGS